LAAERSSNTGRLYRTYIASWLVIESSLIINETDPYNRTQICQLKSDRERRSL